jgi:hypothetical protein
MKYVYVLHKEVRGKKEIKKRSLKIMIAKRKHVGDNLFNQELKDAKKKEDKNS